VLDEGEKNGNSRMSKSEKKDRMKEWLVEKKEK
jgi:hypothetical protein